MEYIKDCLKESNKNLISLRGSLITVVVVITGGLAGLIIAKSFSLLNILFLIIPGIYFDIVFLQNILTINKSIDNNIRRISNEQQ